MKSKAQNKEARILIVEDHPVVAEGVMAVLGNEESFTVVGRAESAGQATLMLDDADPNVAIVDLSLDHGSGLEFIKSVGEGRDDLKIIVFTIHDESLYAERALRAGAKGYIHKSQPPGDLIDAIKIVLSGGIAISEELNSRLLQQAIDKTEGASGIESLSDREMEVFEGLGRGMSTRKIASQLGISVKTVETHRENIKKKLDIGSATELNRYAIAYVENPS